MKKALTLISLAMLAVPSTLIAVNNANIKETSADELATIHVMSCNLAQDGGTDSNKISRAISIITEADPDLIGTQEETPDWTQALNNGLSSTYGHVVRMRGGTIAPNEGSGIFYKLSRFTLLDSGTFWFGPEANEETPGYIASDWGASFARVCEYVTLYDNETGENLCYFNAHYEYGHDDNAICRQNCGEQIVRRMKATGLPGFVTGDMNFYREEEPNSFNALDSYLDESYEYMKTRGGDTGFTFHGYGKESIPHDSPIDYNWYTPNSFVPETFTIYEEEVSAQKPDEDYYSDHFYISTVYRYLNEYAGPDAHMVDVKTFEAEQADINGVSSDPNERMTAARASSNSRPTSNGACVINFSTSGNSMSYNFNLDRAVTNKPLSLWFAPSSSSSPVKGTISVTVNGEEIDPITTNLPAYPGNDHWYDWTEIQYNNIDLKKGPNSITVTNVAGIPGNFDCIDIAFNEIVKISPYEPITASLTIECESKRPDEGTCKNGDEWVVYNENCSRGACIGNWGKGDTFTNYHFEADKATTGASITFYASNFGNGSTNPNQDTYGFWLEVNGTRVFCDESYWELTPTGYYEFQPLHISNLSLKQGDNVFHVEAFDMFNLHNLDKFVVSADESVTLTNPNDALENFINDDLKINDDVEYSEELYDAALASYNELDKYDKDMFLKCSNFAPARNRFESWSESAGEPDPIGPDNPSGDEEIDPSYTAKVVTFEAEDGTIEGRNTDSNNSGIWIEDADDGEKCVANWSYPGNTITWKIRSNEDTEHTGLSLYFSNCGTGTDPTSLQITVNGVPYDWNEHYMSPFPGGDQWYAWQELSIDGISLEEGDNLVVLTNVDGSAVNVNKMKLYVPVTTELVLRTKSLDPVISSLTVETSEEDIKTNSPITITYSFSDDETANDKLTVSLNVYYDYGGPNHKKQVVKNNAFTPTQTGEYTAVLRITDEDDNSVSQTLKINVTAEGAPAQNNDNGAGIVDLKLIGTKAGIIVMSVAGAILVGFIIYICIAKRKKLASNFVGDADIENMKAKKASKKEKEDK